MPSRERVNPARRAIAGDIKGRKQRNITK